MSKESDVPDSVCPNCGYCPHCKRAATPQQVWPQPPYPVQPYWYWQWPHGTVTVTNGTTVADSTFAVN